MKEDITFSDSFIDQLFKLTAGYIVPEVFENILQNLNYEAKKYYYSASSESNLLRILTNLYDKSTFFNDILKYPHYSELLVTAAFNSNFLSDILSVNPEFVYYIANPEQLYKKLLKDNTITEIKFNLANYKSLNSRINFLKNLKRREILKIGIKDLLGICNLSETTEQLSILAKSISSALFEECLKESTLKYNLELPSISYSLCALGKCGGDELNYSSDIDFILFYDTDSTTSAEEINQVLTDAVLLFIKSASEITPKGYLYRIDFRLRPDGKNSPLVNTLENYLKYYESRGEDWERQMLIKMSFVSGDEKLYSKFWTYISHFVYPRTFISSPLEKIALMKSKIEKRLSGEENVKLFSGGIRDIEFTVQALQMLNGGKDYYLRSANTLNAIYRLSEKQHLSENEKRIFTEAYKFYRKIEHYLQLMNDTQTHTIPDNPEMINKISNYLGYNSHDTFVQGLDNYRKGVREIYNSVFNIKSESRTFPEIFVSFSNQSTANINLEYLRKGKGLLQEKGFDSRALELFENLEQELLSRLSRADNPDILLENFAKIIKSVQFPSIWYKEFINDKYFFDDILSICEHSQRAVDLLSLNQSLRDVLLTRKYLFKDIPNELQNSDMIEILFILAIQFGLKMINREQSSLNLSNLIMKKIEKVFKRFRIEENYFIAGLGSLGTGDLSFSSDVDLIFVIEKLGEKNYEDKLNKKLNELRKMLFPITIDLRLRPEGKSSQLIWDLKSYQKYFRERAAIWEFQALSKLKLITGDELLYDKFLRSILNRIKHFPINSISMGMTEMRKKMIKESASPIKNYFNLKKSAGGIVDVEFYSENKLLTDHKLYKKNIGKAIKDLELPDTDILKKLRQNYNFLKKLEMTIQVLFNSDGKSIPLDKVKKKVMIIFMGFTSEEEFDSYLLSIINFNKDLLNDYTFTKDI